MPEEERDLAGKNKPVVLKALVHAADIGNPTREFNVAKEWAQQLFKEFFGQGDKERALGLEISMLCDRKTTNFPKSQIGFLNFLIVPYFKTMGSVVPKIGDSLEIVNANVESYKTMVEEYEEIMKDGNKMF